MDADQMDTEAQRATLIYGINDVISATIGLGLDAARGEIAAERDRIAEDGDIAVPALELALWQLIDQALMVAEGHVQGGASITIRFGGVDGGSVHLEWPPVDGISADARELVIHALRTMSSCAGTAGTMFDPPGLRRAPFGPERDDGACPEDPDGLHDVACGCDYASPDDGRAA